MTVGNQPILSKNIYQLFLLMENCPLKLFLVDLQMVLIICG
jgi:hypothetical protein